MSLEIFFSLVLFAAVSTFTPGPNNVMLMASGTVFGFRKTIPHMLGIAFGFSFMTILVGFGVAGLFQRWPEAFMILKIVSVIYMLWLAWKIANATAPETKDVNSAPLTFLQAVLFQWVNPKAWSMSLSAITLYSPRQETSALLIIGAVFFFVNLPSVSCWTYLGQKIRLWLSSPKQLRTFNWVMAGLLVASLGMTLF